MRTDPLLAERDENEFRKQFTPSERVAIARAIEDREPERRGRPTANGKEPKENPGNCRQISRGTETRAVAAEQAGFRSEQEYRRALKVVDEGVPELVEAMDRGEAPLLRSALLLEYRRALLAYRRAIAEAQRTRDFDAFKALDDSFANLIDAGARVKLAERRRVD